MTSSTCLRTSLFLTVGFLVACGSSSQTGDSNPVGVGGSAAPGGQSGDGSKTGIAASGNGGRPGCGDTFTQAGGAVGTSGVSTVSGGATATGSGATVTGGSLGSGGKSAAGSSGSVVSGESGNSSGGRSSTSGGNSSGGVGGRSVSALGGTGGTAGASSRVGGGSAGLPGTGGQKGSCGPSGTPDIWNLPKFPMATGPYTADWKALGLAYSTPQWWRDAKLGAWAHWDPQSMPEQGDWYAYRMYQQGSADYNYHVSHFGDPSEYGYKDICKNWVIDQWDPNALMDLYVQMGAKFFMAMGSHHDNFDNWDSSYQPWNSVKVGVKKDIVGTWEPIARQKGMRFGIGFHNTPARTWGQWMPIRYASGTKGPFDALQTAADGKGKWWDGMNPADLYGPKHTSDCANNSCNTSAYGTQFMYRVDEAICKYHPDVVYFDDHAGDSQVDLGVHMGIGSIAPTILANYYNKSLAWSQGKLDVVMNMKGVGGQYNSFKSSAALQSSAERGLVRSTEANAEGEIGAYPFQTEYNIQGVYWHIMAGAGYTSAS
ncbi:MAG TPA: alpha-L-fucosidase, partial [Polyangiaceae bacterium]